MNDRVRAIFERAVAFPADSRAAFLEGACDGDVALRGAVEALLRAHEAPADGRSAVPYDDSTIVGDDSTPTVGSSVMGAASGVGGSGGAASSRPNSPGDAGAGDPLGAVPREGPGSVIGRYRILQQIGEGGFGAVFMAEQREPVKRRVALKIIKLGMDTRQVIARFEAERQALAMMDHPNIARVLDAGATETGRPYFVMELVKGVPITEYCDRNGLTVRERLELMIPVCQAIQHAHQKGIIHRDLKPSNVLVTLNDGTPTPKVIDFGIAKATSSELTEKTVFTEFRQFIGTPEYMSPEQAEMSGLDVDTRTDVYSLGVLMYVLVAGTTPFDPKTLRSKGYAEIQRMIVDEEAPRLSTRVSMLGESLTDVARQRKVEPSRLRSLLQGELDWIAMKAMEKDRTRRYDTARDLGDDIRRYLDNEPIHAAPPSQLYRLRKLVRRNRAAATTVMLVAGALVVATVGTTWGMVRAISAERAAVAAAQGEAEQRQRAQENERLAVEAAERAEREATRAIEAERAVVARAAELESMTAFQTSMIQTIDIARMGERMREDVMAEIRASMERMEISEADIATRMAEAESLLEWTNFTNPAIRGIEGTILARAARQIDEQFADRPLIRAHLLRTVAETRAVLGFGVAAEEDFRRVSEILDAELGPEDPQSIVAKALIASSMSARGDWPEALDAYRVAHERAKAALGDGHALTRVIGYMLTGGNVDPIFRERDPEQVRWWAEVTIGMSQTEAELAAEYVPRIFEILDRFGIGPSLPESIDDDAIDAVMDAFDEVFTVLREALGDSNTMLVAFKTNVGRNARSIGRAGRGEPYLREALEAQRRMYGDAHPATVITMLEYSQTLFELDRRDESYALARQGLVAVRRAHGDDHPLTVQVTDVIIRNLLEAGAEEEAMGHLRAMMEIQRRTLADNPTALAAAFAARGSDLLTRRHPATFDLVREMLETCVELRAAHIPESWLTDNARSLLGEVRLWAVEIGATDDPAATLDDARQLLVPAHAGIVAADDAEAPTALPTRRRQSAERLVTLFEVLYEREPNAGLDAAIARWRAELARLREIERAVGE